MNKIYETRTENGRLEVQGCEGNWLDVENYRKSMETWPSFAQKYLSNDGNPTLVNLTTTPTKCGCEIVGCGTLQFPLAIQFCDQHGEPKTEVENDGLTCVRCDVSIQPTWTESHLFCKSCEQINEAEKAEGQVDWFVGQNLI